ncbi:acyltransferase GLAUCE-like [Andrographis paniculata]|uniref:acyltransferase GLAUCE-like n=1 Tax=Andrographis paniculata TaxID=175694 RepID=UPI0021E88A30|nr:acyltransferase GLAUCE-like [Andrographis paniculata]
MMEDQSTKATAADGLDLDLDLEVSISDCSLIYPSSSSSSSFSSDSTFFLNRIDGALSFITLRTLHFFLPPDHHHRHRHHPDAVSARLRTALQRLLDHPAYRFLSGRLTTDPLTDRLEIDCNGAGVGFVQASSRLPLRRVPDFVSPNPSFTQLVADPAEAFDDDPLLLIQVTSFSCGGFVMGLAWSHALFDGAGVKIFLDNLASQAFDDGRPIPRLPCNDRTLLNPRSPPQVPFPHPELKRITGEEDDLIHSVFNLRTDYINATLTLSSGDIELLREQARRSSRTGRVTRFNVVAALVWRCKALSRDQTGSSDRDRESMLLYSVDIRSRLTPPLPENYCGNAVVYAYAAATCRELEEGPLGRIVDRVYEGLERMTDEYARSFIDWTEKHCRQGYADGELMISSWWRLGLEKVDYPWGRPSYSGPFVGGGVDVVLPTPEVDGGGGVNLCISATPKEMDKFRSLFRRHLI